MDPFNCTSGVVQVFWCVSLSDKPWSRTRNITQRHESPIRHPPALANARGLTGTHSLAKPGPSPPTHPSFVKVGHGLVDAQMKIKNSADGAQHPCSLFDRTTRTGVRHVRRGYVPQPGQHSPPKQAGQWQNQTERVGGTRVGWHGWVGKGGVQSCPSRPRWE